MRNILLMLVVALAAFLFLACGHSMENPTGSSAMNNPMMMPSSAPIQTADAPSQTANAKPNGNNGNHGKPSTGNKGNHGNNGNNGNSSNGNNGDPSNGKGNGGLHHANAALVAVNGSGVSGHVNVTQLPHGGSNINVVANGLVPGGNYLSLYYENHTCALEPYSEDDVIGTYTAMPSGGGHTHGKLDDDLDEINSISVRRASDFQLVACANVHPE